MKPYPKYKDSGVEWIGEVPEHWGVEKLKWIAKVRLSNIDKKSKEEELAVELCNYVDVYYNDNITSDIDFMKATARQDQIDILSLVEGDVLITKDSEIPDDIAVPAFVPSSLHGVVCGYHLAHVRPYRKYADGNYLFWSFSAHGISDQFEISANGVTRFGIGKQAIDNSVFLTPPIEEQGAIAAYLDRQTTQIDNLISKKQKLIELLKEDRSATINQAVTKGLNSDAPMKDSGIEWLGGIPEHWGVKRLKYVIALFDHKRVPLSGEERGKMTNKIYDYYGASGIIDRVDDYIFDGEYILIGEDGANLLARNSPLAFKAIGKFWVNNHAHILKPKYGSLDYFTNLLESIDYTIWVSGSAQPKLTAENLANIEIVEPPLKDQTMIVQFIEEKTLKIDNYISKIYQKIELLKEYRTALISKAVTGKIDVRDGGSNG